MFNIYKYRFTKNARFQPINLYFCWAQQNNKQQPNILSEIQIMVSRWMFLLLLVLGTVEANDRCKLVLSYKGFCPLFTACPIIDPTAKFVGYSASRPCYRFADSTIYNEYGPYQFKKVSAKTTAIATISETATSTPISPNIKPPFQIDQFTQTNEVAIESSRTKKLLSDVARFLEDSSVLLSPSTSIHHTNTERALSSVEMEERRIVNSLGAGAEQRERRMHAEESGDGDLDAEEDEDDAEEGGMAWSTYDEEEEEEVKIEPANQPVNKHRQDGETERVDMSQLLYHSRVRSLLNRVNLQSQMQNELSEIIEENSLTSTSLDDDDDDDDDNDDEGDSDDGLEDDVDEGGENVDEGGEDVKEREVDEGAEDDGVEDDGGDVSWSDATRLLEENRHHPIARVEDEFRPSSSLGVVEHNRFDVQTTEEDRPSVLDAVEPGSVKKLAKLFESGATSNVFVVRQSETVQETDSDGSTRTSNHDLTIALSVGSPMV